MATHTGPELANQVIAPISLTAISGILAYARGLTIQETAVVFLLAFCVWVGSVTVRAVFTPDRLNFWLDLIEITALKLLSGLTAHDAHAYSRGIIARHFQDRAMLIATHTPLPTSSWSSDSQESRYVTQNGTMPDALTLGSRLSERRSGEDRRAGV